MIVLNPDTAAELREGMQTSNAIELPFMAPVFYALNGEQRLRQLGGAQYFGGWASDAQKLLDAWDEQGAFPGLQRVDRAVKNKTIDEFITRSLIVAPIGTRSSWFSESPDGNLTRSADYFPGSRKHVQALVMVARKKEDGGIEPWNAAVLSGKGHQAAQILYSFNDWDKHTRTLRAKIAPGVPAWCFYLAIGTFGNEFQGKTVGQGNNTATITPIGAYLPKELTEAALEKLFVGQDVADWMVARKREAQEWLNAWGQPTPKNGNGNSAQVNTTGAYANQPMQIDEPEIPPEPDIPF